MPKIIAYIYVWTFIVVTLAAFLGVGSSSKGK